MSKRAPLDSFMPPLASQEGQLLSQEGQLLSKWGQLWSKRGQLVRKVRRGNRGKVEMKVRIRIPQKMSDFRPRNGPVFSIF